MTLDEVETLARNAHRSTLQLALLLFALCVVVAFVYAITSEQRSEIEQLHRRVGELETKRRTPKPARGTPAGDEVRT